MPLVSLSQILKHAQANKYAIPAFNISFQEQAQAILSAAEKTQSPVIIQLSSGGLKHASSWFFTGLIEHAKESALPICIHRDHCHSIQEVEQAINLGFTSIMMDGSLSPEGIPTSFAENVSITQKAAALSHPHGISIEGEIGCLGSLETGLSGEEDGTQAAETLSLEQMLTDPAQAHQFMAETKIDALAIAIGTSHGAYKFSKKPDANVLCIERVQEISDVIPNVPLVLHGSSSVPQNLCDKINHLGGKISKTYGVPIESIQKAIQHGVCKVNIDTDLRLAATSAIREHLSQHAGNFDPRGYLAASREAMQHICEERYIAFGAANNAAENLEKCYE